MLTVCQGVMLTVCQGVMLTVCQVLTPSLSCCNLKTTNKSAKFETLKPFRLLVFALACKRLFTTTLGIESRCVTGPEKYCLQARPCIFQPGNLYRLGQ